MGGGGGGGCFLLLYFCFCLLLLTCVAFCLIITTTFFPVFAEYEIVTVTGDMMGGGTNANVFITIFGKTGTTRKIHLKSNSKNLFDRGVSDTFRVKANCVGPMKKVRIEHDNTGVGAGWYLERVSVLYWFLYVVRVKWKWFFFVCLVSLFLAGKCF